MRSYVRVTLADERTASLFLPEMDGASSRAAFHHEGRPYLSQKREGGIYILDVGFP